MESVFDSIQYNSNPALTFTWQKPDETHSKNSNDIIYSGQCPVRIISSDASNTKPPMESAPYSCALYPFTLIRVTFFVWDKFLSRKKNHQTIGIDGIRENRILTTSPAANQPWNWIFTRSVLFLGFSCLYARIHTTTTSMQEVHCVDQSWNYSCDDLRIGRRKWDLVPKA